MRYLFLSAILFFSFAACKQTPVKGANGVTYKSPVEYNDYIVNRQTDLMKKVLSFGKIADISLDSAEAMLKKSVRDTEKMIGEIKGMPPYKGDSALRDAAAKSFAFYKRVFEKDYIDILNIRRKGEENITEEDVTEANRIVATISKEEEVLDKVFHNAQQDYAEKNKMKLLNNKAQKDIEKEIDKMGKEN
jgi:predicted ribosome quality control (RQC) complex YloA/Tae2 family protein